ncbi:MAG: acyl-CoA thioesterase [Desulfobacterales bacterium]|nr:acyl-CoA thioesterase [Desulfobacterales bacterium]
MSDTLTKTPTDSESYIAEIVGEESLRGERIGAGKMLHLMDLAAATAAWKHARTPLVTLAFDRIELLNMICHMDYVKYEAYVIKVGKTSICVKVDGFVKSPTEMEILPAHSGVITMVSIDENKKPNPNIPKLVYLSEKDVERKSFVENREKLKAERKKIVSEIAALNDIPIEALKDFYHRKSYVTPKQTELKIQKVFLPKNVNSLGIVFGGETIELMEELALATARQFSGNFQMVTIAMEDVYFLKPLYLNNLVEMISMVTFVGNTTLTVDIIVKTCDSFDLSNSHITNKGTFTILNYDRSGRKKTISTGLNMNESDFESRKLYLQEQKKYKIIKKIDPQS